MPPWIDAIVTGELVPLPMTLSSWVTPPAPPATTSLSPWPMLVGRLAPPPKVTVVVPEEIEHVPVE